MLKKWHTILKSRVLVVIFFVAGDLLSLKSCIFSLNYTLFNKSAINFQNCVILSILHPFWNITAASHSLARYFVAEKVRWEPQRKYGNANLRSRESISLLREQSKMSVRDDERCECGWRKKNDQTIAIQGTRGQEARNETHTMTTRVSECVCVCGCEFVLILIVQKSHDWMFQMFSWHDLFLKKVSLLVFFHFWE